MTALLISGSSSPWQIAQLAAEEARNQEADLQTAIRMGLEHEELTGKIIGAAIEVHTWP